mmetsp:Transcript_3594/g.6799  ORF Transcript_3594/g.6799 Transcript_3594/m.6799 type:complete len:88 (-) Transcript_3594:1343-1606(-)
MGQFFFQKNSIDLQQWGSWIDRFLDSDTTLTVVFYAEGETYSFLIWNDTIHSDMIHPHPKNYSGYPSEPSSTHPTTNGPSPNPSSTP